MNTAAMLIGYAAIFIAVAYSLLMALIRLCAVNSLARKMNGPLPAFVRIKAFFGLYGPLTEDNEYGMSRPDRYTMESIIAELDQAGPKVQIPFGLINSGPIAGGEVSGKQG